MKKHITQWLLTGVPGPRLEWASGLGVREATKLQREIFSLLVLSLPPSLKKAALNLGLTVPEYESVGRLELVCPL